MANLCHNGYFTSQDSTCFGRTYFFSSEAVLEIKKISSKTVPGKKRNRFLVCSAPIHSVEKTKRRRKDNIKRSLFKKNLLCNKNKNLSDHKNKTENKTNKKISHHIASGPILSIISKQKYPKNKNTISYQRMYAKENY